MFPASSSLRRVALPSSHAARTRGFLRCTCAAALLLGLLGCSDRPVFDPDLDERPLADYLVPSLALEIQSGGPLIRPGPFPENHPQITVQEAAELITAAAQQWAPGHAGLLNKDHGREIDFASLRLLETPRYAAAPFVVPNLPDLPGGWRNGFGPYYVGLLGDTSGQPILMVSVAAFTDYRLRDGKLVNPVLGQGNDFSFAALPADAPYRIPVFPERAIRRIGGVTSAQVAVLPEFWLLHEWTPANALLRLQLDRPITVELQRTRQRRQVREVYAGTRDTFWIPSDEQPSALEFRGIMKLDGGLLDVRFERRPGAPVVFEQVNLVGG